jgi:probable rRNA maturation factor
VTSIHIANQQKLVTVDRLRIRAAVRAAVAGELAGNIRISVALVDDAAIAGLNRRFLRHEGPTDVLSFLLEQGEDGLEGEVVASAETARRTAPQFGWSAAEELLLYVIHGTLHLAGYDDARPRGRARMQRREEEVLARLGIRARYEETRPNSRGIS